MIPFWFLLLTVLNCSTLVMAEQPARYPTKNPVIEMVFPDGWVVKAKSGALFANPKDEGSFFLSLAPLESALNEPDAAVKEGRKLVEDGFKKREIRRSGEGEWPGCESSQLRAKGEDEDGTAPVSSVLISAAEAKTFLLMQIISSEQGFKQHSEAGYSVLRSIRPDSSGKLQAFRFPEKDNPAFSMKQSANWTIEKDETGCHIVSLDKQFTCSVIAIDMESISKKVGARYESIVWNENGEPKVKMDDDTCNTLISSEGMAKGGGMDHKVGVYQFAKKDTEKFFILSVRAPMTEAEANGEAVLKMLTSIEFK
jgi:hypothetical protein